MGNRFFYWIIDWISIHPYFRQNGQSRPWQTNEVTGSAESADFPPILKSKHTFYFSSKTSMRVINQFMGPCFREYIRQLPVVWSRKCDKVDWNSFHPHDVQNKDHSVWKSRTRGWTRMTYKFQLKMLTISS